MTDLPLPNLISFHFIPFIFFSSLSLPDYYDDRRVVITSFAMAFFFSFCFLFFVFPNEMTCSSFLAVFFWPSPLSYLIDNQLIKRFLSFRLSLFQVGGSENERKKKSSSFLLLPSPFSFVPRRCVFDPPNWCLTFLAFLDVGRTRPVRLSCHLISTSIYI